MNIQEITRYIFDGKEYNNLGTVKAEVENRIGSIIDKFDTDSIRLTPKQKLHVLKVLIEKKDELSGLLGIKFQISGEDFEDYGKNILDL